MNVEHLKEHQHELVSYLNESGYSKSYIVKIKRAINFVVSRPDNSWRTYEDAFDAYDAGKGASYVIQRKSNMSIVANFDTNGVFPGNGHDPQIRKRLTSYDKLNQNFSKLIDRYSEFSNATGIKASTLKGRANMASSLLHKLQMLGCSNLPDVTEDQMLDLFCSCGINARNNYRAIMKQMILLLECDDEDTIRIISYIPKGTEQKKNKDFLSVEESFALRNVIQNSSCLSLRDRAIGALLYYTGLRCADIAGLLKESVDFERDVISIVQEKTDVPLCLPLRASFGNLLFDYIEEERPDSNSPFVFLSSKPPHRAITPGRISAGIASKLYDAANVRMNKGDKRGGHLFRAHLTTTMVENKVQRPVVSAVIGHENASSIEPYLGIDFKHLKACALSIEDYPLSEEVLSL